MLTLVDVGNTNIKITYVKNIKNPTFSNIEIIPTIANLDFKPFFENSSKVIISSVVPSISQVLKDFLNTNNLEYEFVSFKKGLNLNLPFGAEKELGADLLCALLGVPKKNANIYLLGTANVFMLKEENWLKDINIVLGMEESLLAITQKSELLQKIKISGINEIEKKTNTEYALLKGILNQTIGFIKETRNKKYPTYLVGGNAFLIIKHTNDIILKDDLIFKGMLNWYLTSE